MLLSYDSPSLRACFCVECRVKERALQLLRVIEADIADNRLIVNGHYF